MKPAESGASNTPLSPNWVASQDEKHVSPVTTSVLRVSPCKGQPALCAALSAHESATVWRFSEQPLGKNEVGTTDFRLSVQSLAQKARASGNSAL